MTIYTSIPSRPTSARKAWLMAGAASLVLTGSAALAGPIGGQVRGGQATIAGDGTASVLIRQKTDRAIIDWTSFSVANGESVSFNQPSASSVALNRVTGGSPSEILGSMSANGRVFLINRSGILFGKDARVDVGGLVATTADIDDAAFMRGDFRFDRAGDLGASVVNEGMISVRDAGLAAFVAPHVRNSGLIQGNLARIALGGAETFALDLAGDSLIRFDVGQAAAERAQVEAGGEIRAAGGSVLLTAAAAREIVNASVKVTGFVSAGQAEKAADGTIKLRSGAAKAGAVSVTAGGELVIDEAAVVDASGRYGGAITLAGQTVTADGRVSARSTAAAGGNIAVQAERFASLGGTLDASGHSGGAIDVAAGGLSVAGALAAVGEAGVGGRIDVAATGQSVENDTGLYDASGLTHGGAIRHVAGTKLITSAKYRASGLYGEGGSIDLTAGEIYLFSPKLLASGNLAGGRIRVGGEYQGGKGLAVDELVNARSLVATDATLIDVSVHGARGEGGTVILWSDEKTQFFGTVRAEGGKMAGLGGLVEASSADTLIWRGTVESARGGERGGQLLLDPKNITIADAGVSQLQLVLQAFTGPGRPASEIDSSADDRFGSGVSLDGNRLAVGADGDDGAGNIATGSGAVYLFTFADAAFSSPALQATIGQGYTGGKNFNLTALGGFDAFGQSVSLDGNRLAVGANLDDGAGNGASASGAVYLFSFADSSFSTPTLEATIGRGYAGGKNLDVSALEANDRFGESVSLDGNRLAVGADGDDGAGNIATGSGAVYLFSFADSSFSTPTLEATIGRGYAGGKNLDVSALEANDSFSQSVSLDGHRLAVGANFDDGAGNIVSESGAVYLFSFADASFSAPTLEATIGWGYAGGKNLDVSALELGDTFGSGVSLDGNRLAVGANRDDGAGNIATDIGAVYLFSFADAAFSSLTPEATIGRGYTGGKNLDVSALEAFDSFGESVSLDGNRLAVGSDSDDGAGNSQLFSGAAYLFSFADAAFSSPALQATIGRGYTGGKNLELSVIGTGDRFGSGVSLGGNRLAVGVRLDDGASNGASGSGAVYLFSFADSSFSAPTLQATIGRGYTGGKNLDVSALEANNNFGQSVSLDGNRLAVGAYLDSGAGNIASGSGAVYLFSFADSSFTGGTLEATIGRGYTGGKNLDVSALEASDRFGSGVSLDGNRLAVGAYLDDGAGNGASESGAVYLFSFADSSFTGGTLEATIGRGYTGGKNLDVSALEAGDNFGQSVSLDGNRLAVGADLDDGAGNSQFASGAVYLFNLADSSFSAPTLQATIGRGYTGGKNLDVSAVGVGDFFGRSVALDGNQLAVGAAGDDGAGNSHALSGAVYLFSFADAAFSSPALQATIGRGYTGGKNLDVSALEAFDNFGQSVSLDGNRLAVGADDDDGVGNGAPESGAVYLLNLDVSSNAFGFGSSPSTDVTITTTALKSLLDAGTSVTLQANNDITLANALSVNNTSGNGGALTLAAGRSIAVNAAFASDNGNVTLIANDRLANGVVDAHRDAGAATIAFGAAGAIDAGLGTVLVNLRDGAGKTHATSGSIALGNITGSTITVLNEGATAGSGISINAGAQITASGGGNAVVLSGDRFTNNAGTGAISLTGGGRFLIYSTDYGADTRGGLVGGNLYNRTFAGAPPASIANTGSRFIFERQPTLTFTADDLSRIYGDANPTFTATASGLVNGDTLGDAVTGLPSLSTVATAASGVGGYAIAAAAGTLASDVGYALAFAPGALTVNKAVLTVTADDATRVYGDADPAFGATITGFRNGDTAAVVSGLTLATAATAASNVGAYAITGSGASATNYDFAYTAGTLTVTKAMLTVTADGKSRAYGDANPAFTATITGFRNGDTEAAVSGLALATAATAVSNVGAYAITASGASATNYDFTYVPGTLTVARAMLTVAANDASRVYGDANPAFTASVTGFRNGETAAVLAGQPVVGSAATAASNAGTYAITASGAAAANYDFAYVPGTLTVTKAMLTVTADSKTRTYGDPNPALTTTIAGFRNNDTASVVSGLTLATAATAASNVGAYAITGSGASATNYDFTYVPGTLTVTKALLTVTADNKSRVYGDPNPALTATIAGFRNGQTAAVLTAQPALATSATAASNVGAYAVTAGGAAAANYDFAYAPGTLTVTRALLTVTADDKSMRRGEAPPPLTATIAGFRNNDTAAAVSGLALSTAATRASPVGRQPITAAGAQATNYSFAYAPGTLEILPATGVSPHAVTASAAEAEDVRERGPGEPGPRVEAPGVRVTLPIAYAAAPAAAAAVGTTITTDGDPQ